MRNIGLLRHQFSNGIASLLNNEGTVLLMTVDSASDVIYVITSQHQLVELNVNTNKANLLLSIEDELPNPQIVGLQFIPDLEAICLANLTGEILLYEKSTKQAECVGMVETGITGMAWSPDYEVAVFTTANNTLLIMTKDWDVLAENPLHPYSDQTQVSPSALPAIAWRGDGSFFACSCTDPKGNRLFRVWDRSGTLISSSEDTKGLGNALAWKPSGTLLASDQVLPNKHDIIFYERNGLRNGEFTLRHKADVIDLKWNLDSDILAVLLKLHDENQMVIQLWYSSNFHWFLKKQIDFGSTSIAGFLWDPENSTCLRVVCTDGTYYESHFFWEYNVSEGGSINNPSAVTMFDGNSLLITPLRTMVVPPPMSACTLSLPATVAGVAFSDEYDLAVLLSNRTIGFYMVEHKVGKAHPSNYTLATPPTLKATLQSHEALDLSNLRQLVWASKNCLLGLSSTSKEDCVTEIVISNFEESPEVTITDLFRTSCGKKAIRLFQNKDTKSIFVELIDGTIQRYQAYAMGKVEAPMLSTTDLGEGKSTFPTPCSLISSVVVEGGEVLIGLDTQRSKLYANRKLLSAECNSFGTHTNYLVYTTLNSMLNFVRYQDLLRDTTSDTKPTYDFSIRELERGSRIVTLIQQDTKVVLQLPRGNLEAIFPRTLVLEAIRNNLNTFNYQVAFVLARKHRIDLNLLFDHDPTAFLQHAEDFVKQLNNIDYLNLFISSLSDANVTKTLFVDSSKTDSINVQNKVNTICDALRKVFLALDSKKYLLPLLTTYVKKTPPELEEVLTLIRNLRTEEVEIDVSELGKAKSDVSAETALKYVCWLADVDRMYDVALGMYDFDLVLMVAQRSQKDPKEYLPFLSELKKMETNFQRYTIDKYLGRFSKALRNLSRAGSQYFDKCLELIKEHHLYEEAIQVYTESNEKDHLYQVYEIYGDYLSSKSQFVEAGLAFNSCENYTKALGAFKAGADWRMAFLCASRLGHSDSELVGLGYELAESLTSIAQYTDAANILFDYCKDPEHGIVTILQGSEWQEALRRCYQFKRIDLIETNVLPAVLEAFETQYTTIQESYQKFQTGSARLEVVRTNKVLLPQAVIPDGEERDPNDDNESVRSGISAYSAASSSSVLSSISAYSSSSVGSRKSKKPKKVRKPKKRVTGKEGSLYEEEYLLDSLKSMIPSIKTQDSIGDLVKILAYFGKRDKAAKLQEIFNNFITLVESTLPALLIPPSLQPGQQPPTPEQQAKDALSKQTLLQKSDWKLRLFE